ncbi:MAG TPA: T9SS type A sorting domain-containing protein [Bacteroidia bacterium]|nr:T9SS type A sorting domain-containing protein [Bacteroidia bacterium]
MVIGSSTLINADGSGNTYDIFFVKYDPYGNVLWAQRFGGTGDDAAGLSVDSTGGIFYLQGSFRSNSLTLGNFTLNNSGGADVFYAKCDLAGNFAWAYSATGTGNDYPADHCNDQFGNLYLTGSFESPTLNFGGNILSNTGYERIYIVKIDPSGNVVWVRSSQGTNGSQLSKGIDCNNSGELFIIGEFNSTTLTFGSHSIANSGPQNGFVAKYDVSGNAIWARSIGGTSAQLYASSITCGDSREIYITGDLMDHVTAFGNILLTNSDNNGYNSDGYLARIDSSGNYVWAKSFGYAGCDDGGMSVSFDHYSGNLYSTGYCNGPWITFDSVMIVKPFCIEGTFLVEHDANGVAICGSILPVEGSVVTDKNGNVFEAGYFMYDPLYIGSDVLHWNGGYAYFLAKFEGVTGIAPATQRAVTVAAQPNPSNGKFTIKNPASEKIKVEIFNSSGLQVMSDEQRVTGDLQFDISDQPAGIYFVRITNTSLVQIAKVVKE